MTLGTAVATATITDNETTLVSVSANDPNAAEAGSDPGQFTVDLGTVNNTGAGITVNYTVTGTATGADYTVPSGAVVIADGLQTATIDVTGIVDDLLSEGNETVIVTLTGTSFPAAGIDLANDTATVTIVDDDVVTFGITSTPSVTEEGLGVAVFTLDFGGIALGAGQVASVVVTPTGTAADGVDHAAFDAVLTAAAGATPGVTYVAATNTLSFDGTLFTTTSFAFSVAVIDDALVEGTETIEVTLSGVVGANLDAARAVATTTITEADNTAPVINAQLFTIDENSAAGTAVGALVATDPDVAVGQFLTYSIIGGNAAGAFAIDPATGQLTVLDALPLDFEVTPTFVLTIRVTDSGPGALSDTADVTIQLNDLNEVVTPPPPIGPSGGGGGGSTGSGGTGTGTGGT
ncbi:MAG: hypothetical protein GWN07_31605, partial [Actinobacteria bacterium]|nr:cadherin repeat domain-containing protein [Actinomycetota bacterium]NIV58199.1 hypothetical protein [Actinomycetota bacterium]NIW31856.1 hypothetical protein [Actinomycetota bacterium]NIX24119.1 hypothetical protein [Actinomycetota bacterium]